MERISVLGDLVKSDIEDLPVGAGEIQHPLADEGLPGPTAIIQLSRTRPRG